MSNFDYIFERLLAEGDVRQGEADYEKWKNYVIEKNILFATADDQLKAAFMAGYAISSTYRWE